MDDPTDSFEISPRAVLVTKTKLGELRRSGPPAKQLPFLGHSRKILVMNKLECATPMELVLGISEHSFDRGTFEPDCALQIENRDDIRRMLDERTEVRFALLQGKLRFLAIGNVQGRRGHPQGLTAALTHDLAATMNRPYFAVGADDSAFHVVGCGPCQRVVNRRQDPVVIVREYRRHKAVEGHL